jgi:hypothetical protein
LRICDLEVRSVDRALRSCHRGRPKADRRLRIVGPQVETVDPKPALARPRAAIERS